MKKINTVYTNTRTNEKYVLEPCLTCGDKLCLISMKTGEQKFVAPATLKRWYLKEERISEFVTVSAFTGMHIGVYETVTAVDGQLEVWTKNNKLLRFDPDTGIQTNARNPKFANRITWTV